MRSAGDRSALTSPPAAIVVDTTGVEGAALERLYRAEANSLARGVARRGRDADEAGDVVHDAFVRLARLGNATMLDRPQAYLRRVVGNLLRDRRRADARCDAALHISVDDVDLPSPDLQAQLEARDMLRRIEAAMERLPAKTRAIFMAHRVEGLSYAEIAVRWGMTVKGVEKQMSKALIRLDRLMARR